MWNVEEVNGLPLLFSPKLRKVGNWLVHAFTTRHGGVSPAPLESFNLARHWHTVESQQDALNNRERLCSALKLDHAKLAVPSQKHTNKVTWITEHNRQIADLTGVDALATETISQSLLLHFADCVPIIMADANARKIAVVHAGWRGTAAGIVRNAINELIKKGSQPEDIVIAIGPAIRQCCFETGPECAEQLCDSVEGSAALIEWKNQRPYPDLQAINALQALACGVGTIDVSHLCTSCHPEMFYSHRRFNGQTGRQGAIAGIVDE